MSRFRFVVVLSLGAVAFGGAQSAVAQAARDTINIVGSSTVYPFATAVAEQFGRAGKFKTPKVESTGTGGGIKLFCNGVGVQHPDVANASRRMNANELETCRRNGVADIIELKIGFDGLTIATSKRGPQFDLTRREVYLALAKQVPDPARPGKLIDNPYKTWRQIAGRLPARRIEVLGPPPTSGTRDSLHELYLEAGCRTFDWIDKLRKEDEKQFKRICHTLREDGAYIEAGENDNLIAQKLIANPNTVGIFGFSFYDENQARLRALKIDNVAPSFESISSGRFPAARPLYVYVKKAHIGVIPGLQEFVEEFVSARAIGEDGYLVERGLVPLPQPQLAQLRADIASGRVFSLD
ncbi:MAG: substrate-binding domain-containing protein [Steroidobacteraceae bacterium]|nr:substrate-binding domain-containing protein [Steroidobacteraceae bacterium]MDW8258303.1 substrate-binding domain-containing protein [Gammaproteobacteria bacterium]